MPEEETAQRLNELSEIALLQRDLKDQNLIAQHCKISDQYGNGIQPSTCSRVLSLGTDEQLLISKIMHDFTWMHFLSEGKW